MAYSYQNKKGVTYFLNLRGPLGRSGKGKLFFFSKKENKDCIDYLPDGYTIIENPKTGLPILKRKDRMKIMEA
ncbi:MAG: hypothetical protein ACK40G_08460 [Cytophagaceae bacterium]